MLIKSGEDDRNPQVQIMFDKVVQALEISKLGYLISIAIVRDLLNKKIDENGTVFFIIFCLHFYAIKHTHADKICQPHLWSQFLQKSLWGVLFLANLLPPSLQFYLKSTSTKLFFRGFDLYGCFQYYCLSFQ